MAHSRYFEHVFVHGAMPGKLIGLESAPFLDAISSRYAAAEMLKDNTSLQVFQLLSVSSFQVKTTSI